MPDQRPESSSRTTSAYSRSNIVSQDVDSSATQQMRAMLDHTLQTYPPHYQAALRSLLERHDSGRGFSCEGAMETALSEEGMTIAFDFRRRLPAWGRLIIEVTMSFGEVVGISNRELKPGERSGIQAFDSIRLL